MCKISPTAFHVQHGNRDAFQFWFYSIDWPPRWYASQRGSSSHLFRGEMKLVPHPWTVFSSNSPTWCTLERNFSKFTSLQERMDSAEIKWPTDIHIVHFVSADAIRFDQLSGIFDDCIGNVFYCLALEYISHKTLALNHSCLNVVFAHRLQSQIDMGWWHLINTVTK